MQLMPAFGYVQGEAPRDTQSVYPGLCKCSLCSLEFFGTTLSFMLAQKILSTEVFCMGRSLWIQLLSDTALKTRAVLQRANAAAEMEEKISSCICCKGP